MYYVFVCSMGSLIFCIFRRFYCYILKDLNKRLWTTIAILYYSGLEFYSSSKMQFKSVCMETSPLPLFSIHVDEYHV